MLKVVKEIFIYILLLALIALIFGILFYEQLPSNKLVPEKVEYELPEKLQAELEETLAEDEDDKEVLVTYAIEENDLNKFEDNDKYNPGKIDPFAEASTDIVPSGNEANNNISLNNGTGGGQLTETKPGK